MTLCPKKAGCGTGPFTRLVSAAGKEKPEMSPGLKEQAL